MTDPITSSPSRPVETNALPIEAPTVAPTPDAWERARDLLFASMDSAPAVEDPNELPPREVFDPMLRELYAAYSEDGAPGVHTLLNARPELLQMLARLPEDGLQMAIRDANDLHGFFDGIVNRAGSVVDIVRDHLEGAVRSRMLQQGQSAAQQMMGRLEALSSSLPEALDRLRQAEPGTADAQIATLLGITGVDDDLARAQAKLERLQASIADFASRMAGFTWEPGDFPETSARALSSLGLDHLRGASLAGEVADEMTSDATEHAIDWANLVAELAFDAHHIGAAVRGIAAAGATAGTLGTLASVALPIAAGVVIEHVLTHQIELNREQFRATGRMLGIR